MSRATIVLCFPVDQDDVARISESANRFEMKVVVSNQQEIGQDIFAADIFCGHAKQQQIDWPAVVQAGKLKWIQSSAAGLDHCLDPTVIDSNIVVSGCSGLFATQVGEQTIALLFGLLRKLPVFFRAQLAKDYRRRPTDELQGKTVGIVGLGGNGQRIAEMLGPFQCTLLATDCFANDLEFEHVHVLPETELFGLAERCDIIIATLPLTPATNHLMGDSFFETMKPGSYFLNVGRGSTVDQSSLIRQLQNGHLAGAGLDVVQPEPLPADCPLWEMENVIITPHVGAQSRFRVPQTVELFCNNLTRFMSDEDLLNLVDKQLGFPSPENRLGLKSLS